MQVRESSEDILYVILLSFRLYVRVETSLLSSFSIPSPLVGEGQGEGAPPHPPLQ